MRDLHTRLQPVVGHRRPRPFYHPRPIRKVIDSLSQTPKDTRRITTTPAEAGLWMLYLESKEAWKRICRIK